MDECINCAGSASERYTLVLSSDTRLENEFLCEECASEFRNVAWIDVGDASALVGDGGTDRN